MRVSLIVAFVCVLGSGVVFGDMTEPQLMGAAQRAYLGGDYDTATQLFAQVLEMDPQNTLAIQFLRKIKMSEAGQAPTAPQDPLKALVLPKIEFKDATFAAALDFFKAEAGKQSVTVSFVAQLPAAQMQHTVTLSLSNIPFLDALTYLCQLNGATYKVQPYAIVIMPAPVAGAQ